MLKHKIVDFIIQCVLSIVLHSTETVLNDTRHRFMEEVDKEISEMKLSLNARARVVAESYLTAVSVSDVLSCAPHSHSQLLSVQRISQSRRSYGLGGRQQDRIATRFALGRSGPVEGQPATACILRCTLYIVGMNWKDAQCNTIHTMYLNRRDLPFGALGRG